MTTTPLAHLDDVTAHLYKAWQAAVAAADELDGARRTRARELVDDLADAFAFAVRLATVVEGDARGCGGDTMSAITTIAQLASRYGPFQLRAAAPVKEWEIGDQIVT